MIALNKLHSLELEYPVPLLSNEQILKSIKFRQRIG